MIFNGVIKYMKYSTICLSGITMLLFPESKNMCMSIISIIGINHIATKISKYLYKKNVERADDNRYGTVYFNVMIMIKICCMKFISLNIPSIKYDENNYPLRVSYELLNIFWKTYSNIIYISYISTVVTSTTFYLTFPIIKNYIYNFISDANNNALITRFRDLITITIINSNTERIERNNITIEKLDEICPLRCKNMNNVENSNIDECCICKDKFNDNELHRKLPCNHTYHAHCIEDWIIRNKKCPICRYELQI
jgi:hypothetical protein